jgi:hypothetical protein
MTYVSGSSIPFIVDKKKCGSNLYQLMGSIVDASVDNHEGKDIVYELIDRTRAPSG